MANAQGRDRGSAPPQIGVCLSAGGFRTALYGIGALRYLAEAQLLPHVVSISAVSGGSVLGAWLAQRWPSVIGASTQPEGFCSAAGNPFRALLSSRNFRNRWLAASTRGWLAGTRNSRGAALAKVLARDVLTSQPLGELADGVQLVLTSTDLVTGQPFHFARDFIGSADYGYAAPPPSLPLATAVAASAAAPQYFSPVLLRGDNLGLPGTPPLLSLVDGAVYEKLGTEWFEDWDARQRPPSARRPQFLVVIDGARPLDRRQCQYGPLRAMRRAPQISAAHMRSELISQLRGRFAASELRGVIVAIREPLPADVPFPLRDTSIASWPRDASSEAKSGQSFVRHLM
jgi:NTE family protein